MGKEFTDTVIKEHFQKESPEDLKSALNRLIRADFGSKIVQKTTSTRETCSYQWLANIEDRDINDQSGHTSEADEEDDDGHIQRDSNGVASENAALRAENSQLKMQLAAAKADLALVLLQDEMDENLDEVYLILM